MAPTDYVYGVTLDGLSRNVTVDDLKQYFAFASSNITFSILRSGPHNTSSIDIGVSSKAELSKLMEAKPGLEASNVTMSQPTISHRPAPLLSPAASLSSLQPNPVFTNYQLPASPPFHFDNSPAKPSRIFQSAIGGQDDLPKNVYVLNLPLDMSQGEFEGVFSQFGKIEHACLLSMLDSLGRRRGFLLMASYEEACNLVNKTQGRTLKGCRLEVSWAQVQKGLHSDQQGATRQPFSRFQPPPSDSQKQQHYNSRPQPQIKSFQSTPPRQSEDRGILSDDTPPPHMTSTTVIADGLCVKAFPTIDHVIRGFLPRGDVTGASFLPDLAGETVNSNNLTRSASVTFKTLREAANAVSWMHGRFYGGKQIRVRWEGEGFARKARRPNAPVRLDFTPNTLQGGQAYMGAGGGPVPLSLQLPPTTPCKMPTSAYGPITPDLQLAQNRQRLHMLQLQQQQQSIRSPGNQFFQPISAQTINENIEHHPLYLPSSMQWQASGGIDERPTGYSHQQLGSSLLHNGQLQVPPFDGSPGQKGKGQFMSHSFDSFPTPLTSSEISFEGAFPTALTPVSWTGSDNKTTSPPSPGTFTPFSPIINNEDFDVPQIKEENDVLGILAGLSCDDDVEEEKMLWDGLERAKDFGPIGQERRNSVADA